MKAINNVIDAPDEVDDEETFFEFCVCKNDTGDDMVKCSNSLCNRGTWFHITCIGLDHEEVPDDDWWCSDVCQATERSQYCICHMYNPSLQTIKSSRGNKCTGGKVFHLQCLGMKRKSGSKWKCAACRSDIKTESDNVFLYTCALLYKGLQDRAYRDTVRENDDVQGWQPARLKNEIIWNRTANIKGGAVYNKVIVLFEPFNTAYFYMIFNPIVSAVDDYTEMPKSKLHSVDKLTYKICKICKYFILFQLEIKDFQSNGLYCNNCEHILFLLEAGPIQSKNSSMKQ
ncbi:hypothetical protein KUTeg_022451 [Tegillarca granosa]|uniref:Zinc finger PHD-type domain-containing protein n=1 Tax=Tegillarca granosa TaxID=220873 RepID=A0ABQ9EAM2_TEGGR|nr:hypothetical protein KUTeg_022451 [Tegillarca granosa]